MCLLPIFIILVFIYTNKDKTFVHFDYKKLKIFLVIYATTLLGGYEMKTKKISMLLLILVLMQLLPAMSSKTYAAFTQKSARQFYSELKAADYPISRKRIYGSGKDVMSRYKSRLNFFDGGSEATFRIYYTEKNAVDRYEYIKFYDDTFLRERVYRYGNAVINADYELSIAKWKRYKSAVKSFVDGKKIKQYPLKLNRSSLSLSEGKSYTLKLGTLAGKKIKWSSSNKKIATVSSNGKVTARKTGKCTIVARYKKKKYKCSVSISVPKTAFAKVDVIYADTNGVCYKIKNNGTKDITVDDNIRIYYDYSIEDYVPLYRVDYEPFDYLFDPDPTISPGETKTFLYADDEYGAFIYSWNSFSLALTYNGKRYTHFCYEEKDGKRKVEFD